MRIKYDLHNADILLNCAISNAIYSLTHQEIDEINLGRNITLANLSAVTDLDWTMSNPKISNNYDYELVLTRELTGKKIMVKGNLFGETILYRI